MFRYLIFVVFLITAGISTVLDNREINIEPGKGYLFPTCRMNSGKLVHYYSASTATFNRLHIGDGFSFITAQDERVIVYDRDSVLFKTSQPYRMFLFLHECGHHVLNHFDTSNNTPIRQQEVEADCYAALRMHKQLHVSINTIKNQILPIVAQFDKNIDHPSGKLRTKLILECLTQ